MKRILICSLFLVLSIFFVGCGEEKIETIPSGNEQSMYLGRSYTDGELGFSLYFPEGWRAYKDKNNVVKVMTLESVAKPAKLEDQQTEIEIRVKGNPDKLSIDEFYNGINDANLFLDANNGKEEINVGGMASTKFLNVVGVVPCDIVVAPVGDKFYEIKLNDQRHQSVFAEILKSIKFN